MKRRNKAARAPVSHPRENIISADQGQKPHDHQQAPPLNEAPGLADPRDTIDYDIPLPPLLVPRKTHES